MNVYNGNITTDRHGLATGTLPDYFEALNGDFRYQLTVNGQFAQSIVPEKIANKRFVIRTSKPNLEVSWPVTGIRHDAYANTYRIPVEEDKAVGEQGYYLHPEVFGQSASKSIQAASHKISATDQLAKVSIRNTDISGVAIQERASRFERLFGCRIDGAGSQLFT
jgi:trimeric autotransporter adhesin